MPDDEKEKPRRKYDRLMERIEMEENSVMRIKYIKTLDQRIIIEERLDGKGKESYYLRKKNIHDVYNENDAALRLKWQGKSGLSEEILSNNINRFEVLYAEIEALLMRSGYYLEIDFDGK